MARPVPTSAEFPKLRQNGETAGIIAGRDINIDDKVEINTTRGQRKTWTGKILAQGLNAGNWVASVEKTLFEKEENRGPETVTVTVTNSGGMSGNVDTTSDVP